MQALHQNTLAELSDLLHKKTISSVELTRYFIDRIKQQDSLLNTFITLSETEALAQAQAADDAIASGTAGPLTGIPIAQKDIFCTKGIKTSCASRILDSFISPYDATLIEKMHGSAGMVLLGKTNMDEFAMGSSTEHSYYGACHNPWDLDRVPGGSSGGSAAAVAARLAPAATGTDTGGSIRQPAAFCGVTGLKPSYGRISRYGMVAFASSLDQAGPITQTAEDAALLMNSMAGHDPKDSTSIDYAVPDYTATLQQPLTGKTIGLPKEYFKQGALEASVATAIEGAINTYQSLGAKLVEINLPHTEFAAPVYYAIASAECSSNLARFDGVRYGYRCDQPVNLQDLYVRSRTEGFGREVKRRILIGVHVLSSKYYDAYYLKAQKVRHQIQNDFIAAFKEVDVVLAPVTPSPAFKQGEKAKTPVEMYLSDIFTIAASLAGLPALSLPAGLSETGLPIGVQLIGPYWEEPRLLNLAHQYQTVTHWHRQMPDQFASELPNH